MIVEMTTRLAQETWQEYSTLSASHKKADLDQEVLLISCFEAWIYHMHNLLISVVKSRKIFFVLHYNLITYCQNDIYTVAGHGISE